MIYLAYALLHLWARKLPIGLLSALLASAIMFLGTGIRYDFSTYGVPVERSPNQVIGQRSSPLDRIEVIPLERVRHALPVLGYSWTQFWESYSEFMFTVLSFEFAYTTPQHYTASGEPVMQSHPYGQALWEKATQSLKVVAVAMSAGTMLGLILGMGAVLSRIVRVGAIGFAVAGLSLPDFFLVMLGQLVAIWSFKTFGARPWSVGVPNAPDQLVLPMLALSVPIAAYIARLTVNGMDDVMHEEYIRTARAKGLSQFRVLGGHALRNALPRIAGGLPTIMNTTLSSLLVVEVITSMTGLGRLLVNPHLQTGPGNSGQFMVQAPLFERASVVLIFCLLLTFLDLFAHSIRIASNPLLREGQQS